MLLVDAIKEGVCVAPLYTKTADMKHLRNCFKRIWGTV